MEDQGTKDGAVTGSKADQKKDSTEGPLSETEVCSDFGFIEPALKCIYRGVWRLHHGRHRQQQAPTDRVYGRTRRRP